ncbi:flagellin N-terminal helical domain-containing protein [Gracilibacillus alcaliphilus]|uniref:flagellin N-terminal helical domain-containing protein n=1 Tax=Gracilibacillus alcaliphilus TaxID=1401441 RepID=UPI0019599FDE|nr:flagellin [Gracilibacillus alcaliphilus]MBM7676010.1 flagellin [Gracilibacillus alcaliphilus]
MRINDISMAMSIYHHMNRHYALAQKSMLRIASGKRINSAADDPAGLAISERMRAQIRGMNMAIRNTKDGISLLQTAEGAVNESHAILQRMRELSVQAANGTYSDSERKSMQDEINMLREELTRIGGKTQFNTQPLLEGSFTDKRLQVGANSGDYIEVSIGDVTAAGLGIEDIDLTTQSGANDAIDTLDEAIKKASSKRAYLGAMQNRLGHTINNLENSVINLSAAESRIRDADIAKEMMLYAKHNILAQVAQAMLAQANQMPQMVLQLLR